jgi:hypothetical protein
MFAAGKVHITLRKSFIHISRLAMSSQNGPIHFGPFEVTKQVSDDSDLDATRLLVKKLSSSHTFLNFASRIWSIGGRHN